jgi:O-antigen ligase
MSLKDQPTSIQAIFIRRLAAWSDRTSLAVLLILLVVIPLHARSVELGIGGASVLVFLWSVRAVLQKRMVILWSPLHWILLLFLGIGLLQLIPMPFAAHRLGFSQSGLALPVQLAHWSLLTVDPRATTGAAVALAALIGYFSITPSIINNPGRLRLLVNWLIAIGFAIAILWMLNRVSPSNAPWLGGSWPWGFYFRQAEYVGLLELIVPLPLGLIFAQGVGRDQAVLYGFAAVAMGVALATAERTAGVLALGLELLILTALLISRRQPSGATRRRSSRLWMLVGLGVIVGSLVAGVTWMATRPIPQMISFDVTHELKAFGALEGPPIQRAEYAYARISIWKTTLRLVADHPLLGVGLGAFPTAYTRYDPAPGVLSVNAAHNDYLQLLSETGAVGGILMLIFLLHLGRMSRRSVRHRTGLGQAVAIGAGVGCGGILAHSLVDFYLHAFENALMFCTLVALLLIVVRQAESQSDPTPATKLEPVDRL